MGKERKGKERSKLTRKHKEIRQGKEKRKGMQMRRGIIYIYPTARHFFSFKHINHKSVLFCLKNPTVYTRTSKTVD